MSGSGILGLALRRFAARQIQLGRMALWVFSPKGITALAFLGIAVRLLFRKITTGKFFGQAKVHTPWALAVTLLLQKLSVTTDRKNRLFRLRCLKFVPTVRKDQASHSHPGNAAQRADASRFMDDIGKAMKQRRFDASISPRETTRGTAGNRLFRHPKDLLSDPIIGSIEPGDFVSMVDTDGHLDALTLNSFAGHDMVIYTLCPDGLTGSGPESFWQFTTPCVVTEEVAGGATYEHQIWDWNQDLYVLSSHWKTYVYDIVRYQVGPARAVIVLSLARTIYLPLFLCDLMIPGISDYLPARMQVEKVRHFLVGSFGPPKDRKTHILNTHRLGTRSTMLAPDDYVSLLVASKVSNSDGKKEPSLLPSGVQRYLTTASKTKYTEANFYVLADYFSSSLTAVQPLNYQSKEGLSLEQGTPYNTSSAPGPVPPAVAPVASANNDQRAVTARMVKVINKAPFPNDYQVYASEFVKLVVKERSAGKSTPFSYVEVAERQNRPSQRARRDAESPFTELKTTSIKTQGFMKKEPGASASDPRVINTVPTDQTNRLSKYTYAAKQHFKLRCARWYCPGKSPETIAQSIRGAYNASMKRGEGKLVGGDYSRMDGRTSLAYREHVYEPIMYRLFAPEHTAELKELLEREREASVSMRSGARARTFGSNLSGSPDTTDLNTCDSAFNEYAARRVEGESPQDAYEHLGLYFGDDSLFSDVLREAVGKVSETCGMVMTIEEEPVYSPAGRCVFLSRVYPDITSSLASYPCMVRALSKLRTATVHKGSTQLALGTHRKLKGQAAAMVDGHVPVLGPYARLLENSGGALTTSQIATVMNIDRELAYKLQRTQSKTVLSPMETDLFVSSIGRDLCIPPEEVIRLDRAFSVAKDLSDIAHLRLEGHDRKLPDWAVWADSSSLPTYK